MKPIGGATINCECGVRNVIRLEEGMYARVCYGGGAGYIWQLREGELWVWNDVAACTGGFGVSIGDREARRGGRWRRIEVPR